MSSLQVVRAAAGSLGLLDTEGNLTELDSLGLIDLLCALESSIGRTIPVDNLSPESFQSIHTIADMLGTVVAGNE